MTSGVLLALPGPEEAELVSLLDAPGSDLQVVRRCADLPEVMAAAIAGLGVIAVVAADLPGVDRTAVSRLATAGVHTVLVTGAGDLDRARALGAAAVTPADAGAAQWAQAVQNLLAEGDVAPPPSAIPDDDAPSRAGRLAVVWGPRGAPGRSTVALNLAHELAEHDDVLLIDADTEAPSISQLLGVLDETAGIAAAARLAADGRLDRAALTGLIRQVHPRLQLLTGITRADRWRELPAPALEVLWEESRPLVEWIVVDVGAGIEEPGGMSPGMAPRRHQAALSALGSADVVVVVGAAEPVGMHRLVLALQELTEAAVCPPHAERVVVVNRVRGSAAGAAPDQAVIESLARFAGVTDPVLVPDDRPSLDRAVLEGHALVRAAPGSKARAAIGDLAGRVSGERRSRRRPRRTWPRRAAR